MKVDPRAQQFIDITREGAFCDPIDLMDHHLYSQHDGLYLFVAYKSPGSANAWLLARLNKETGQLIDPIPGGLIAYVRGSDGYWRQMNAGIPDIGQGEIEAMYVWDALELTHMGESLADYNLIGLLQDLNLGM